MALPRPIRVLALTRYIRNGPSSRYRFYQFEGPLAREGVTLEIFPLLEDWYIDYLGGTEKLHPWRIALNYVKRIKMLLGCTDYDLIWVEKEILPWFPFGIEKLLWGDKPVVVDLDDNHFQRYEDHSSPMIRSLLGAKMARVVTGACGVTSGSPYLTDLAHAKGASRVCCIPTVVDLDRYPGTPVAEENPEFVIGWIGTTGNVRYVEAIRRPLSILAEEGPIRIVAIGAPRDALAGLPVEIRPWSEDSEIADLSAIDVGIMPLPDAPFERGKCGLKLIQYMAAWKPTIASPVGVNPSIVVEGVTGFLAHDEAEWLAALRRLRDDRALRRSMGAAGRRRVAKLYSIPNVQGTLAEFLRISALQAKPEMIAESIHAPAAASVPGLNS